MKKEDKKEDDPVIPEPQPEPDPPPPEPQPEPEPPPEPINICQFPVLKVQKIVGWSHGYENLAMKWRKPDFTLDLWDKLADQMAKYVNAIRFFAYISENKFYLKNSFIPFLETSGGKYDLTKLSNEYIQKIGKRLKSYHERKITTIICLASSIKAHRFPTCPFNGDLNINGTTRNVNRFFDDEATIKAFDKYMENMVRAFDNQFVIWELINEPNESNIDALVKWYKGRISKLVRLGVPIRRIAIEKFDSSKLIEFLEARVWVFWHGVNSVETLKRFHRPGTEMQAFYEKYPRLCASADGGDYMRNARGLIGKEWNPEFRRASSKQTGEMIRYDLKHEGNGVEFMSASAFLDGVYPNLRKALKIATKGLTKKECEELGVDYEENRRPELKAIAGQKLFT